MKSLPLPSLRAFEAAARLQNFRAAATELGMSAAAISQHVRQMEAWVGVPLFQRHARGVQLTEAGRMLGQAVTSGLGGIVTAAERLTPRGKTVRIASLPSVVTHWLAPRLPRFRALHPDIQVSIRYAAGATTPIAAEADLLILHGARPSNENESIAMFSGATRPTCSPGHLERHGPLDTPEALATADLLHDESPTAWRRWFEQSGLDTATQAGPVFADFNLLIGSLLDGQGVALCPTSLFEDQIARGSLVVLSEHASDLDKAYWLVTADAASRETLAMRTWLLSEAGIVASP